MSFCCCHDDHQSLRRWYRPPRRYDEAIPLLRTRLQLEPEHVESLYNLGMVYSDRMQLPEARQLLSRAVELDPGHAYGQVALGIAALRDNDPEAAQGPLEKAVVLQPRNPFALRTLGQLLLMKDNHRLHDQLVRLSQSHPPRLNKAVEGRVDQRCGNGSVFRLKNNAETAYSRDVECPGALCSSQQTAVEQRCESGAGRQRQG